MRDLDPQWIEAVARVLWCDVFTIDDSAGGPDWDNVTDPVVRFGMLADAETILTAVTPLIEAAAHADERAKVADEIARAIDAERTSDLPFVDTWIYGTEHGFNRGIEQAAAIARQHAAAPAVVAAAGLTPTPESPGKHDAHNDHDDRQEQ